VAGILMFCHALTVDFCFIVEDNICCLIINVKPVREPDKDLTLPDPLPGIVVVMLLLCI